jgi:hypothetical protein
MLILYNISAQITVGKIGKDLLSRRYGGPEDARVYVFRGKKLKLKSDLWK